MEKRKLVIEWGNGAARLLAVNGAVVEETGDVLLRDLSGNSLVSKIRNGKGRKKPETILLLPGTSVIERRFEFEPNGHGVQEALLEKIRQSLPVSLDEVSYGVRIQKKGRGFSGILLATPLRPLYETLKILEEAGLCPDEIFSSAYPPDQKAGISLLPREKKLERQKRALQELRRDCFFLLLFLCLAAGLGVKWHASREESRARKLRQELASLKPQVLEIEKVLSYRAMLEKQADRNRLFLRFLKEVSEKAPGETELDELLWDKNEICLRGTSLSYPGVTGISQALEGLDFLGPSRLGYARLRKKESRDYFEFEITAGFKSAEDENRRGEMTWSRAQRLLESRSRHGEAYEALKKKYRAAFETPDLMNAWSKELMAAFESNGLKVRRLEPQGSREIDGYQTLEAAVECDANLKGILALAHALASNRDGTALERIQLSKEKCEIQISRKYPYTI